MTEVPKIVYDRLRAAHPDHISPDASLPMRAHPDADLLTALTEQTLSAAEREGVLEHLALCGDCRELIALALPPVDSAAGPIETESEADRPTPHRAEAGKSWLKALWPALGGPGLRWAALAAGVAVAASVLLLHPGRLNQAMLPPATRLPATAAVPFSAPVLMQRKGGEVQITSGLQTANRVPATQVAPSNSAASEILLADNRTGSNKKSAPAGSLTADPPARSFAFGASPSPSPSQGAITGEVATAAPPVTPEPSADAPLMARNDAPAIEKAKPAPQAIQTQDSVFAGGNVDDQQQTVTATPGLARSQVRNVVSAAKMTPAASQSSVDNTAVDNTGQHNTNWKIQAGVLQRSLNSGQSWQDALHPNRPLLCYATGNQDVWAGGQSGTLFHSIDGGVTWVQVRPSIRGQQLSSDIIHIQVQSNDLRNNDLRSNDLRSSDLRSSDSHNADLPGNAPASAQIVVSTSSNEIWISTDGGSTWASSKR